MESWKEVPHLFANGKFKYRRGYGAEYVFNADNLAVITHPAYPERINECKLKARPISDMSDDELDYFTNKIPEGDCKLGDGLIMETYEPFLYLLSIGVYPFDQSHFESGEVIARYVNGEDE